MLSRIPQSRLLLQSFLQSSRNTNSKRALSTTLSRQNTNSPNPGTNTSANSNASSSSFRDQASRYKPFVSPFAKVFLGAIFTYQVIYWTWLKLEIDEEKVGKNQEVAALEKKARELTGSSK